MKHFGLLGHPIGHSLSPLMYREIYRMLGCQAVYSPFDVHPDHIDSALAAMRVLGVSGGNVTSPHKRAIFAQMDELSPAAEQIGAVNLFLLREDGSAFGDNADWAGFAESLRHCDVAVKGQRFVLCGTGGAHSAVHYALEQGGAAEILSVSRTPRAGCIGYDELRELSARDVIVNCTPLGMHPNEDRSPVEASVLSRFHTAVDLIYNPAQTLFLRQAQALGLTTLNGLWMLLFQGLHSAALHTGLDVSGLDADALYAHLSASM